jgi:hypothetical protein
MNSFRRKFTASAAAGLLALLAGVVPLLGQTQPEDQSSGVERDVLFIQRAAPVPPPGEAPGIYWFGGAEAGVPAAPPPGAPMGPMISFVSAVGGFGGNTVAGAPYSAEAVTEIEQRLADGNRIVRKTTATIYRDSEGRTRRDQTLGAIGPWVVGGDLPQISSIYDPVENVRYMLNHTNKTAHKLPSFAMPPGASGLGEHIRQRVRAEVASGFAQAGVPAPIVSGAAPPAESGADIPAEPFEIPLPPPPGIGFQTGIAGAASPPDRRTESLGTQLIEGVEAEGTRSISTIPAGAIGNDFAIEIVSERWYSPELQTVILSLHKDPRMGETTYRLTSILRTEPSSSLFEGPEGYTVVEPKSQPFPSPASPAP